MLQNRAGKGAKTLLECQFFFSKMRMHWDENEISSPLDRRFLTCGVWTPKVHNVLTGGLWMLEEMLWYFKATKTAAGVKKAAYVVQATSAPEPQE